MELASLFIHHQSSVLRQTSPLYNKENETFSSPRASIQQYNVKSPIESILPDPFSTIERQDQSSSRFDAISEQNTNAQSQKSDDYSTKNSFKCTKLETKSVEFSASFLNKSKQPQCHMTDKELVRYVYKEFSTNKGLEQQVDEVVEMAQEIRIKETVRGNRIHQYWSHE